MLNAGFLTLDALKSRLLPEAARIDTTYDSALSKLGLAIARRMEMHCNRRFSRSAAVADEFSAYNLSVVLSRYPVEAITTCQLRDTDGTLSTCETIYSMDPACGLVDFFGIPGCRSQRLVITYTGGYWLDPEDGSALPTGAEALPDDILEAFIAEVQAHAEARNLFDAGGLRSSDAAAKAVKPGALTEATTDTLRPYLRFSGE